MQQFIVSQSSFFCQNIDGSCLIDGKYTRTRQNGELDRFVLIRYHGETYFIEATAIFTKPTGNRVE